MAGKPVPITGPVLQWAMKDAGVSRQQLAQFLGVTPSEVQKWELGQQHPATGLFHKLAKFLGRPESFFLLPRPPQRQPTAAAFRRFTPNDPAVTVEEAKSLRLAERVRSVTQWVRQRSTGNAKVVIPPIAQGANTERAADLMRHWLNWQLEAQTAKDATDTTVNRAMRTTLQDRGIIVMHLTLSENSIRGFCLPSDTAPLIAVSTRDIRPARLFSYVHEAAHLLIADESVCLTRQNTGVERWCNQVAGALLMPEADFREHVSRKMGQSLVTSIEDVSSIRARYKVSLQACAIRLENLGLGMPGLFDKVSARPEPKRRGGTYDPERVQVKPRVRLQQYGRGYVNMLLDATDSGVLPESQVLDLLKISRAELGDIRAFASSGAEG